MDKQLALAVAFFIIFLSLSGCVMDRYYEGSGLNLSMNWSMGANNTAQPNVSGDTIPVGNLSKRAPPPLPE